MVIDFVSCDYDIKSFPKLTQVYMVNWRQGKDQQDDPTTLQGRTQARPPGTWHKRRLLGSYCHRQ